MSDTRLLDKAWRVANLYSIRDKNQNLVRFTRNRAQAHYQEHRHTRNLILKSRQLGFTTDEAIDSLDDTLFTKNMEALMIAHNLDAATAIFDKKIELAWKTIHPDLKKLYKVDASNAHTLKFEFGDGSFSSLSVDTSGRSGTYNRVHVTEFAEMCKKYPARAREVIEGTIPAVPTNGRVDIESTSQGASGLFYDMCMIAMQRGEPTSPLEYKFHFYNWTWDEEIETMKVLKVPTEFKEYQKLHKLSDKEISYYFQKWVSLNQNWNALRREYPTTPEEAFEAIVEGTYYGVQMGMLERAGRITSVPHDPANKVYTIWDLGVGENLVIIFVEKDKLSGNLKVVDYWTGNDAEGLPEAIVAVKNKPYVYGKHFAPHDIKATDMSTGKSRLETAKNLGITFDLIPEMSVQDGINAAALILPRVWFDKQNTEKLVLALKNYSREWDERRGMYKDLPYHNWASHGADATRYMALCEKLFVSEMEATEKAKYFPDVDKLMGSLPDASSYKA